MKSILLVSFSLRAFVLVPIIALFMLSFIFVITTPQLSKAQNITINGDVSYKEKIALPQHAFLIVQLIDITNADGPSPLIGETAFEPSTQVPIKFQINIDEKKINPKNLYALQARIVVGDILWFVSDQKTQIDLQNPAKSYSLNLAQLSQNNKNQQNIPLTIDKKEWLVEDIFGAGIIDSSHMTIFIDDKIGTIQQNGFQKYSVAGSGGCNHYTTDVIINAQEKFIDFEAPTMTFMACAEAISQQEYRFMEMIQKAKSYLFDDIGRLILKDEQGNYIGRLVPNL